MVKKKNTASPKIPLIGRGTTPSDLARSRRIRRKDGSPRRITTKHGLCLIEPQLPIPRRKRGLRGKPEPIRVCLPRQDGLHSNFPTSRLFFFFFFTYIFTICPRRMNLPGSGGTQKELRRAPIVRPRRRSPEANNTSPTSAPIGPPRPPTTPSASASNNAAIPLPPLSSSHRAPPCRSPPGRPVQ